MRQIDSDRFWQLDVYCGVKMMKWQVQTFELSSFDEALHGYRALWALLHALAKVQEPLALKMDIVQGNAVLYVSIQLYLLTIMILF